MKKLILLLTLTILLCGCNSDAPVSSQLTSSEFVSSELASSEVSSQSQSAITLADQDSIETAFNRIVAHPRTRGTTGELDCAQYLQSQLQSYGYTAEIEPFSVYKTVNNDMFIDDMLTINPRKTDPLLTAHNVIAQTDFDDTKKTIVFSAHYDSTIDSVGAIDNASGTAVLLELSRLVAQAKFDYNVRIIFFSAEEYYLSGSRSYVSDLSDQEADNIAACFNIDMTSTSKWRKLMMATAGAKPNNLSEEFMRINGVVEMLDSAASDEVPFTARGILGVRYTSVDYHGAEFPSALMQMETENIHVSTAMICEDAKIIYDFMQGLEVDNLFE